MIVENNTPEIIPSIDGIPSTAQSSDGYSQFLLICQRILDQAKQARKKEMDELEKQRHWLERRQRELKAIIAAQVLRGDLQPAKTVN